MTEKAGKNGRAVAGSDSLRRISRGKTEGIWSSPRISRGQRRSFVPAMFLCLSGAGLPNNNSKAVDNADSVEK